MEWVPTIEDFDTHLFNLLSQFTIDKKRNGKREPIFVTFFTPEHQDTADVDHLRPAIVIHRYDQMHDRRREQTYKNRILLEENLVRTKHIPTPHKFFYQFTLIADYQTHLNELETQLHHLFPARGYIALPGPDGNMYEYDFYQSGVQAAYNAQFINYGATKEDRIFRRAYRYQLFAEIDEYPAELVTPVVETVVGDVRERGEKP